MDPSDDLGPSYSQDGRWIYFTSLRSGQFEVWKMPAEGGDATQVTRGGGRMPVESPDGKTLYYAQLLPEKGVWKMPVQGGEAVQVTGPVTDVPEFVVTAEGIYYAAAPESPNQHLIQFLSFSTGKTRPVVVTDRQIGRGLSVSPDQRFLAFAQRDQTGRDLMLVENFVVR
jgi:Tol biopolymer transport system component